MRFIFFKLALLVSLTNVFAQTDTTRIDTSAIQKIQVSDYQGLMSIGLGDGSLGMHYIGLAGGVYKSHSLMARLVQCEESSNSLEFNFSSKSPQQEAMDIAILYGYSMTIVTEKFSPTLLQVHIGAGRVTGITRGEEIIDNNHDFFNFSRHYEPIEHAAIGFAYQIQIVQSFSQIVGLSLAAYGNINKDMPIHGVAVMLTIGKLY